MIFTNNDITDLIHNTVKAVPSNLRRINTGIMNFNYEFHLGSEKYIIRFEPKAKLDKIKFEFDLMSALYIRKCKVPEPVKLSLNKSRPFLIYKRLKGSTMPMTDKNNIDYNIIGYEIAENLKCLSGLVGNKFGSQAYDKKLYDTWESFLKNSTTGNLQLLASKKVITGNKIEKIHRFINFNKQIQEVNIPRLVWSDISRSNIILHNNRLSGFIDLEGCFWGDPVLAVGYLFAIEGDSDFYNIISHEFNKHFEVKRESVLYYAFLRMLRLAKYIDSPTPTGIQPQPMLKYFKGLKQAISEI